MNDLELSKGVELTRSMPTMQAKHPMARGASRGGRSFLGMCAAVSPPVRFEVTDDDNPTGVELA